MGGFAGLGSAFLVISRTSGIAKIAITAKIAKIGGARCRAILAPGANFIFGLRMSQEPTDNEA